MDSTATMIAVAGVLAVPVGAAVRAARRHHVYGTPTERAAYEAMHTVSLAAPVLREGLSPDSARKSARHLRRLLGTAAVAITDAERLLAWDGEGDRHAEDALVHAKNVIATGRVKLLDWVTCGSEECPIRDAVIAPLIVDGQVVGALAAYNATASVALTRAVCEVARWVSSQLELAQLDQSRTRAMEAEIRALRAQISPHFIYNSLTAIASFVRTDPPRARELLLEFADFTRYSFRRGGSMTTLAEELRCIDCYFQLEQARFGDQLELVVRVAPETLGLELPFLCLQPLVENAVRHGLRGKSGKGTVTVSAAHTDQEYVITISDDGIGMDPSTAGAALSGKSTSDAHAVANIQERLLAAFGSDHGLQLDSAPGEGTTVTIRIPKPVSRRRPITRRESE
ncbi:histidine kinase [Actinocrinis puniceicyclus]|uniref:Histidine kinase n=1 Tax=Actinocrinis puniceicyclus TaxID=977794 RepID=A0A8J8BBS6_9ACTN|nr:histidine kinase [Actinocrinis puniceicyclus]MBS2962770.1 histidine kinase [Actinocrinis puniceicyclus]